MTRDPRPLPFLPGAAALGLLVALLAAAPPAHARRGAWTSLSPDGGQVCALAVDPSNPETLYAGTDREVFKSTDGGAHWFHPHPGPILGNDVYVGFCMLAIDPQQPSTLYAASYYQGLVKTVDGGRTWSRLSVGLPQFPFNVWDVAFDPRSPDNLYAGTSDGLYFSPNGGATWRRRFRDPVYRAVTKVAMDADRLVYALWGPVVYRSSDQGRSWTPARKGIPASSFIESLAIDPRMPKTLLTGTTDGLYRTTNRGRLWTRVAPRLIGGRVPAVVFERSSGIAYAATEAGEVFRSIDGGIRWSRTAGSPSEPFILTLAAASDALYAGTIAGAFRSPDAGATWDFRMQGISNLWIGAFAIDPSAPSVQYVASSAGLYKTEDGGRSWSVRETGIPRPFDILDLAIDPLNPVSVYLTFRSPETAVLRSNDAGDTWQPLRVPELAGGIVDLQPDPRAPAALWAAARNAKPDGNGLFHTMDGGITWTKQSLSSTEDIGIDVVRVAPGDPETVCAAGSLGSEPHIYCTTDGGGAWQRRDAGLPRADSTDLVFDPADPAALYVLNAVGLFRTLDGGVSWRLLLSTGNASGGALTATSSPPFVLYATSGRPSAGVLRSTDRGETWTQIGNGLEGHSVKLLAVDPRNPARLYAGTSTGGLFTYTMP